MIDAERISPLRTTNAARPPRLMAVLAHPDDESLGVGGTLAKYVAEGADVFLLTATRGDSGRYRGFRPGDHPSARDDSQSREASSSKDGLVRDPLG